MCSSTNENKFIDAFKSLTFAETLERFEKGFPSPVFSCIGRVKRIHTTQQYINIHKEHETCLPSSCSFPEKNTVIHVEFEVITGLNMSDDESLRELICRGGVCLLTLKT